MQIVDNFWTNQTFEFVKIYYSCSTGLWHNSYFILSHKKISKSALYPHKECVLYAKNIHEVYSVNSFLMKYVNCWPNLMFTASENWAVNSRNPEYIVCVWGGWGERLHILASSHLLGWYDIEHLCFFFVSDLCYLQNILLPKKINYLGFPIF